MSQPTSQVADDRYFKIIYPKEMGDDLTLKVKAGSSEKVTFKIENRVGFALRVQVSREVQNAAAAKWFSTTAIADLALGISDTTDYALEVIVPNEAPAGDYAFVLEVVDLALPDENIARSLPLTLQIEAARQTIPLWLIIFGAVLLLAIVGGGIAVFILSRLEPTGQIHIAYTQNLPPNRLHLRLPTSNINSQGTSAQRLTEDEQYARFLDEQAEISQITEYQPAWSPDSCKLVYGASIEVGRYFLNYDETLFDLRALLSIPADEMEALATSILDYPALTAFLDANPAYTRAALESRNNPYLALAPQNTALVSYYQRTLERISPEFGAQFYRRVADFVYNEISRGTLYGLFQLDITQALDSPQRIQLLTWSRLDGNARYLPANPAWYTAPDGSHWLAFEFAQDVQRSDQPAYIALYHFGEEVAPSLYLLQSPDLRASNGLYYEREPQWWQNGDEFGLVFVSRRNLAVDNQRQAQLYRVTLSFGTLEGSGTRLNPLEALNPVDVDYANLPTLTPTATADANATAIPTALPTPLPTATLFALPLQVTRVINAPSNVLSPERTAELALSPVPTLTVLQNLGVSNLENLSENSVNDTAPLMVDSNRIIFVSDRDGLAPNESQHLYLLDLTNPQTPVVRRLTNSDNNILELQPSLSGDTENLIFVRQTGRAPQLYTLNWLDSQEPTRLTESNSQLDTAPAWQPQICPNAIIAGEGGQ